MPGLSQTDCLAGKGSEGDRGPCAACQSVRNVSNWVSAVQVMRSPKFIHRLVFLLSEIYRKVPSVL